MNTKKFPTITSASLGQPDPIFFVKLKEVFEDIKNTLKDGIADEQKLYFAEEIVTLQSILDSENSKVQLRPIQRRAIQNIIILLKKGQNEGYVKLPTGVGKTILFASMIEALGQATLIMVPTKDLVEQTADVFKSDFAYDEESIKTINPSNGKSSSTICQDILNDIGDADFTGVIVTTNDSLKSIFKSNPELFAQLKDKIDIYVTDEAHRALGDVHRDMLESGLYDENKQKLHLMFTATPQLRNKNVGDYYEEIINVSLGEAIKEGILVMPQFRGVGKAILNTSEGEETDTVTQEFLDKNSLKFVDENGKYIYERLVDEYIASKENLPYQYAPGIGICATIEQAEFIKNYLISRGIRAIRVTSANKEYDEGYSAEEAKKMLMADKVDIVVTVTKVAEGWDVPTLRNIIRFAPTLSQARQIQSFGRILRNIEWRHIEVLIKAMNEAGTNTTLNERELSEMLLKRSDNTFLIEADSWQIRNSGKKTERENEEKGVGVGATAEQGYIVYTHPNTVQALFNEGELGYEEIRDFFGNVDIQYKLPEIGENGRVEIDGKMYQWVGIRTPSEQLRGIDGQQAKTRVHAQPEARRDRYVKKAKSMNGHLIDICEIGALKEILVNDIGVPEIGENGRIEIDGKMYQWVGIRTPSEQLRGIDGQQAKTRVHAQPEAEEIGM